MSKDIQNTKTDGSPAALLQIAVQQGADVESLEKLTDLSDRWEAKQSQKSYYNALTEFQRTCPVIERADTAHTSKYATLERIVMTVRENLADCGLSYRFEHSEDKGQFSVTCVVTHIDGHSERTTMTASADTSGSKNPIQALGSTTTYLQRYTLLGSLGIVTGGEDVDGGSPANLVSDEDLVVLRELLDESSLTEKAFLQMGKLKTLADLDSHLFKRACARIKKGA